MLLIFYINLVKLKKVLLSPKPELHPFF